MWARVGTALFNVGKVLVLQVKTETTTRTSLFEFNIDIRYLSLLFQSPYTLWASKI
jgi:hypothetical protein